MILFRRNEIAATVLPEELSGRLVIGYRRLSRRLKIPAIKLFSFYLDECSIGLVSSFIILHGNSPKPCFTARASSLVHRVLGLSRFSKIYFTAIKSIPVNVVNIFIGESHYQRMKSNLFSAVTALWDACLRINIPGNFLNMPLEAAHHIRVRVVDKSRLALRQWDFNHSYIVSNFGGTLCR